MRPPVTDEDEQAFRPINRIRVWFPFRAGDAVRITRGPLANATGTVLRTTTGDRCIITIDGVGRGVSFVLPTAWLVLAEAVTIR